MTTILVDHNIEGWATLIFAILIAERWAELLELELALLADVGLSKESSDRDIWRMAQARGMLLLTANRTMTGSDSLERTMREEGLSGSLPVLTIGSVHRLDDSAYREACAERLAEIVVDIEQYRGVPRTFIP